MLLVWWQIFRRKMPPKEKAPCKCLSIIMLDSVIKAKKKYYPQTLLEECKYEQEKIKMENLTDDDLEKSSSDESDSEADNFLYIDKKNYKTPFLSMKLELFIMLIASFLLIYQKWIL